MCQQLLESIEQNCGIKIADIHKKCVIVSLFNCNNDRSMTNFMLQLAGLLHDIGHGPYSHLWEHCVHQGCPSNQEWTHESQSVALIKDMVESNKISLHSDEKIHDYCVELITSFIIGDCEVWKRLLKPSEMYLTEIVSNKYCNIDVDKCDYLLRDYYYVHREIASFEDFFKHARIINDEHEISHIAYHVNDFQLIENMFTNRAIYHNEVYQLAEVAGVEKQIRDICVMADRGGLEIGGLTITKVQKNCSLYLKLDDTVLDLIRTSTIDNQCMNEAKKLLKHLDDEHFYKCIFESHNQDEVDAMQKDLVSKFGDNFCTVNKKIPNAAVPKNIPLYDDNGATVQKESNRNLCYESVLLFYKAFDDSVYKNILNFVNNNNF